MNVDASVTAAWEKVEGMARQAIVLIPNLVLASLVFCVFLVMAFALKAAVRRLTMRRKRGRNLALILGRLSQGLVVLLGLFVALSIIIPSFRAGSLVQLLGISGVAIGFAFRDVLQNFLAGILILLTEPFQIGDQIAFKEYEGTVEDIQTRATLIKTYDGRLVVIPNAELFTHSVTVNTAFDKRRIEYDVGVGYGDDLEKARLCILDAIGKVDGVLTDPSPDVLVMEFQASSILIRARWWISPPRRSDSLEYRDKVLRSIKRNLAEAGIDLPFPTQHILFHDQTEETDGDRRTQREGWPVSRENPPARGGIAGSIRELTRTLDSMGKGRSAPNSLDRTG